MKPETRRQFLRGAGGFALALPFLESLAPRNAFAGVPPYALHPRFVCMSTQHGGIWGANMFPGDSMAPSQHGLYPGHMMHHGPLATTATGPEASLSPVLTASASALSDPLVAKMNVVRGLDVQFYLGHHTGGDLGNYARNDGEGMTPMEYRPTIDQVMAYSPSFYPDSTSIKQRSLHIGTHQGHCWGWSNPASQSGTVEEIPLSQNALALFNVIFVPDTGPDPRPLVVDRVIESYKRLHDGTFGDASRLSSKDRQRLDDHMDRLHDLETRLKAKASCGDVAPPLDTQGLQVGGYSPNTSDMIDYYQRFNDVIVAAFICGTSRIAVVNSGETWSTQYPGLCCDWHDIVAHESANPDGTAQQIIMDAKRLFFESVFLDLANKLDAVEEAPGISCLDNSLLFWTQESGSTTHDPISLPVVTAGSAAGFFETGKYFDYRNRDNMAVIGYPDSPPEHALRRPGVTYNQWLATVLQAMGVPPSEFERPGEHGYGLPFNDDTQAWPAHLMDDASEILPLMAKT